MKFTLATHNLHDETGVPTFFADVIIFTEAIPKTIRARAKQRFAFTKARLDGYRILTCHQQPDLVVAVRRRLFKVQGSSYTQFVDGWAHVTPNRGTFLVHLQTRGQDPEPAAVLAEHRINAWHPSQPDRGEREFRARAWHRHTQGTWDIIRRLQDSRYRLVFAGGDLNTPTGLPGYPAHMNEVGEHLDRLAASCRIGDVEYLSRKGSDHPRLRATVRT